jgi:hypothetical protein
MSRHGVLSSVVVCDFNAVSVAFSPAEANSPLIIDSDRILTATIADEFLQSIARYPSDLLKGDGCVKGNELLQCTHLNVTRHASN